MGNEIEKLQKIIDESRNIVFFGGAGVSTESGIPDFRSQDGLYNQKYDYPPETILSHTFFMRKPEEFFKFQLFFLTVQIYQVIMKKFFAASLTLILQNRMRHILSWRRWSKQES